MASAEQLPIELDSTASASSATAAPPYSPPSDLDHARYRAQASGQSISDIAHQEEVPESEILDSLLRVRIDRQRYSAEGTGVEMRRLLFSRFARIGEVLDSALAATKLEGKKVVMIDKESGEAVTLEEHLERPDHEVRLKAVDTTRQLLAVVQPRDPAVQITSNSQTNILNQGQQPALAAGGMAGLTSPEAVIRQIVAMRQQPALTAGQTGGKTMEAGAAATVTTEGEVMARDSNLPDEELAEELEGEDGEDSEDGDEDSDEDDEEFDEDSDEDDDE